MQYSFEGDELKEVGVGAMRVTGPSVFTKAIVQGLRTGDADLDMDGSVSPDDLYEYTFENVRSKTPLVSGPWEWREI